MVQKAARRGRPPQYDAAAALAQARDAFWRQGFQATSLDDLTAATGMNRPSLYAAFGDKRALFLKTLRDYRRVNAAGARALLERAPNLRDGLRAVFNAAIALYLRDPPRGRGCFILGSAPSEAESDEEVRAELRGITEDLDAAFAARMKKAGLSKTQIEIRAPMATGIIHSLSLRARGRESKKSLAAFAERAAALLGSD
ncbi:MAG: TetR/AcrR family transcriptional regulator [Hyphomonadaceae bacterium]